MKSKMSIMILLASFLGLAIILLVAMLFMLQSGMLSRRTATIALPSDGGFVEAWTQHLPHTAKNRRLLIFRHFYSPFLHLATI